MDTETRIWLMIHDDAALAIARRNIDDGWRVPWWRRVAVMYANDDALCVLRSIEVRPLSFTNGWKTPL